MIVLAKVMVVYETKYGNTKLVAEKIVEGMREVQGIDTFISEIKEVDLNRIVDYDAILIGSPTHFGGPIEVSRNSSTNLVSYP